MFVRYVPASDKCNILSANIGKSSLQLKPSTNRGKEYMLLPPRQPQYQHNGVFCNQDHPNPLRLSCSAAKRLSTILLRVTNPEKNIHFFPFLLTFPITQLSATCHFELLVLLKSQQNNYKMIFLCQFIETRLKTSHISTSKTFRRFSEPGLFCDKFPVSELI